MNLPPGRPSRRPVPAGQAPVPAGQAPVPAGQAPVPAAAAHAAAQFPVSQFPVSQFPVSQVPAGPPAAPPGGPGRRDLLRAAAAAAGAGALAACTAAPPRAAAARGGGQARTAARPASPTPTATRAAAAGPADWAALRRALSTRRLLRRGDPGYGTARLLFEPRFDYQRPAAVGYCRSPADVAACLDFARRFGVPVTARSGGHSYAGWSGSTGGLIIDVTPMNSVLPGPGPGTVTAGAGLHLIDFYQQLAARGVTVPGGSCATVGLAGLTLGGGVGVVSRAYGLTCDNLTAVQIVTADGSVLDASPAQHSDLLWACQGGGGGNFGVATSFTFRTRPLPSLAVFFLYWPWPDAARVIKGWQAWAPHAPDALWSNLHLTAAAGGTTPTVEVGGTCLGSAAQAGQLLGELYAKIGSPPTSTYLQGTGYLDAMLLMAGCSGKTVPECHLPWQAPGGTLSRVPSFARSDFFTRPLPPAAVSALLAGVTRMQQVRAEPGGTGAVAFDALGGAVNRVHPAATAFVHRSSLFLAQYSTSWPAGPGGAGARRQRAWLDSVYAAAHPHASGEAYQNYPDPRLAGWQAAYYGANYPRLTRIKKAYDPRQLFRFPQGITPG
jgi:FAD/FMN-containing dehydrogenase